MIKKDDLNSPNNQYLYLETEYEQGAQALRNTMFNKEPNRMSLVNDNEIERTKSPFEPAVCNQNQGQQDKFSSNPPNDSEELKKEIDNLKKNIQDHQMQIDKYQQQLNNYNTNANMFQTKTKGRDGYLYFSIEP